MGEPATTSVLLNLRDQITLKIRRNPQKAHLPPSPKYVFNSRGAAVILSTRIQVVFDYPGSEG
jgi:hypothetical protein